MAVLEPQFTLGYGLEMGAAACGMGASGMGASCGCMSYTTAALSPVHLCVAQGRRCVRPALDGLHQRWCGSFAQQLRYCSVIVHPCCQPTACSARHATGRRCIRPCCVADCLVSACRCWLLLARPCGSSTTMVPLTKPCLLAVVVLLPWRCHPTAHFWQWLAWTASCASCPAVGTQYLVSKHD